MVPREEKEPEENGSQVLEEAPLPPKEEATNKRISIEEALEIIKEVAAKNPH